MLSRRRFLQSTTAVTGIAAVSHLAHADINCKPAPAAISSLQSLKDQAQPITAQERADRQEKARRGAGDTKWLKSCFQKLLLNFTWWVNRKDAAGRNIFQGGFLGLDNIGVFDRSAQLPTGGTLEQADGTAWMAFYAQNMLEMAVISNRPTAPRGWRSSPTTCSKSPRNWR